MIVIENGEIVIRIQIASLPIASGIALERKFGVLHPRVIDAGLFAQDLLRTLLEEEENGDTAIHRMFDESIVKAAEDGAQGIDWPKV